MFNSYKKSFKQMLSEGQVFAPCVWDAVSAQAAELAGFKAGMLGGAPVAAEVHGYPDLGLITADDLVKQCEYVCDSCSIPIIVDADDGYGESPINTYRLAKHLVRAGASGFSIEDSTGVRGFPRWGRFRSMGGDGSVNHPLVSKEVWLSKIAAALDACAGTDCLVIARTEAKMGQGLDVALERAAAARELGADLVLVMGTHTLEEAEKVSAAVPGWKMWPDITSDKGVPDLLLSEMEPLGFNFVTAHIYERGLFQGLMNLGQNILATKDFTLAQSCPISQEEDMMSEFYRNTVKAKYQTVWLENEKKWLEKGEKY